MQYVDKNQQKAPFKWDDAQYITLDELQEVSEPTEDATSELDCLMLMCHTTLTGKVEPNEIQGSWEQMAKYWLTLLEDKNSTTEVQSIRIESRNDTILSNTKLNCIKTILSHDLNHITLSGKWAVETMSFIASSRTLPHNIALSLSPSGAFTETVEEYYAFLQNITENKKVKLICTKGKGIELACHELVSTLSVIGGDDIKLSTRIASPTVGVKLSQISWTFEHTKQNTITPFLNNILLNKNIVSISIKKPLYRVQTNEPYIFTLPPNCGHLLEFTIHDGIQISMRNYNHYPFIQDLINANQTSLVKTCQGIRDLYLNLSHTTMPKESNISTTKKDNIIQYHKSLNIMNKITRLYSNISFIDNIICNGDTDIMLAASTSIQSVVEQAYRDSMDLWRCYLIFLGSKGAGQNGTHISDLPSELLNYIMGYVGFDDIALGRSK